MFGKYESVEETSKQGVIDIATFVQLVRTGNGNQDKILELHQLDKGTDEYTINKKKLPAITPNAVCGNARKNDNILFLSSYMFFDIDVEIEHDVLIPELLDKHSDKVCFISKSVGGRGLSFYVKCEGLTQDNFKPVYEHLLCEFEQTLGVKLDQTSGQFNRLHIIPFDENAYYNSDISFNVSNLKLEEKCQPLLNHISSQNTKVRHSTSELKHLPSLDEVTSQFNWRTYTYNGPNDFDIREIDYCSLALPKAKYADGEKRKRYTGIIAKVVYNNPHLTFEQVLAFMDYINTARTIQAMEPKKFVDLVRKAYEKAKSGKLLPRTRKKFIHINKNLDMSAKDKRIFGSKVYADFRTSVTRMKIIEAKRQLTEEGTLLTVSNVCERASISKRTYHRHNGQEPSIDLTKYDFSDDGIDECHPLIISNLPRIQRYDTLNEDMDYDDEDYIEVEPTDDIHEFEANLIIR